MEERLAMEPFLKAICSFMVCNFCVPCQSRRAWHCDILSGSVIWCRRRFHTALNLLYLLEGDFILTIRIRLSPFRHLRCKHDYPYVVGCRHSAYHMVCYPWSTRFALRLRCSLRGWRYGYGRNGIFATHDKISYSTLRRAECSACS
jgi:hypothetical protein